MRSSAVRIAAVALLMSIVLAVIWSVVRIALPDANDDYLQDTYYVVVSARVLRNMLILPTTAVVLVIVASFKRNPRGAVGLWLMLAGAVMMMAPGMPAVLGTAGITGVPRRYSDYVAAAASLNSLFYGVAFIGLVCVLVGGAIWALTLSRANRDGPA